ncbi:MAG: 2-amino-4-hydroxy-6-hydroxymethyldihydropteridine diphosphokinase [Planctomycetota bacterium]
MTSSVPTDALVAFGSNLGDSRAIFAKAQQSLAAATGIEFVAAAQLMETEPVTGESETDRKPASEIRQPTYCNSVFRLRSTLDANRLMETLLQIESEFGRQRGSRWSARSIDLDLILFGDQMIETETLTIPHPRMSFRRFVLEPAAEVAGEMFHPACGCSVSDLLDCLNRKDRRVAVMLPHASPIEELVDEIFKPFVRFGKISVPEKVFFREKFFSCKHEICQIFASEAGKFDSESSLISTTVPERWESFNLLIVFADVTAKQWSNLERRFAGPTLLISTQTFPEQALRSNETDFETMIRREIRAALEAM